MKLFVRASIRVRAILFGLLMGLLVGLPLGLMPRLPRGGIAVAILFGTCVTFAWSVEFSQSRALTVNGVPRMKWVIALCCAQLTFLLLAMSADSWTVVQIARFAILLCVAVVNLVALWRLFALAPTQRSDRVKKLGMKALENWPLRHRMLLFGFAAGTLAPTVGFMARLQLTQVVALFAIFAAAGSIQFYAGAQKYEAVHE